MAKTQRAEEMLDAKQRETLWKLFHGGYEPELLGDRYGMSLTELEESIRRIGAERKRNETASTDWRARYVEYAG